MVHTPKFTLKKIPLYFDYVTEKTVDVKGADSTRNLPHWFEQSEIHYGSYNSSFKSNPTRVYFMERSCQISCYLQKCPEHLVTNASTSGTINEVIMIDYFNLIIKPYLQIIDKSKFCLILDEARSQYTPECHT